MGPTPRRRLDLARLAWLAALAALLMGVAAGGAAFAQGTPGYAVAGSIAAYLGVLPAEVVAGHAPGHPERGMHGGPPRGRHAEHLVVALFDDASGARIEDASVTADVTGMGGLPVATIELDPMPVAGVVTYGGYVSLPGADEYSIDLRISRPGDPALTVITFPLDHPGP